MEWQKRSSKGCCPCCGERLITVAEVRKGKERKLTKSEIFAQFGGDIEGAQIFWDRFCAGKGYKESD
jgi:hypothetical protein